MSMPISTMDFITGANAADEDDSPLVKRKSVKERWIEPPQAKSSRMIIKTTAGSNTIISTCPNCDRIVRIAPTSSFSVKEIYCPVCWIKCINAVHRYSEIRIGDMLERKPPGSILMKTCSRCGHTTQVHYTSLLNMWCTSCDRYEAVSFELIADFKPLNSGQKDNEDSENNEVISIW